MKTPAFQPRLDELLLQDPNSEVSRKAITEFLKAVKVEMVRISGMAEMKANMSTAPLQFPAFPEPGRSGSVKPDTVPTFAYNWCVSPLTPMGVAGVIWVAGEPNIGYNPADYSAELEIYARSLPATYGQENVPFFHAQPSATLLPGITPAKIPNAKSADFDQWPKSLKDIATQLGTAAR